MPENLWLKQLSTVPSNIWNVDQETFYKQPPYHCFHVHDILILITCACVIDQDEQAVSCHLSGTNVSSGLKDLRTTLMHVKVHLRIATISWLYSDKVKSLYHRQGISTNQTWILTLNKSLQKVTSYTVLCYVTLCHLYGVVVIVIQACWYIKFTNHLITTCSCLQLFFLLTRHVECIANLTLNSTIVNGKRKEVMEHTEIPNVPTTMISQLRKKSCDYVS